MTAILDIVHCSFLEVQSGNGTALGFLPFYHLYGTNNWQEYTLFLTFVQGLLSSSIFRSF